MTTIPITTVENHLDTHCENTTSAKRSRLDLLPIRILGSAILMLGIVLPKIPGHPGLECPLLKYTGIPCPLCGMTTGVENILEGHFATAANANPFSFLVVVTILLSIILAKIRFIQIKSLYIKVAVPLLASASWIFQLVRFHII